MPREMPARSVLGAAVNAVVSFDAAVAPRRPRGPAPRNRVCSVITAMSLLWIVLTYSNYNAYQIVTDADHFVFDGVQNKTNIVLPTPFSEVWRRHPHLVAIGVLTGNDDKSSVLRDVQRRTWFEYEDVAKKDNEFQQLVLPLFVAGLLEKWPPYSKASVQSEADEMGDILFAMVVEQTSTTGKGVGEKRTSATDYGSPSMMTNARKASLWFRYAYQHFVHTPFLAKADLDTYINIPAYLTVLLQLPRVSTKYGRTRPLYKCIFENGECLSYVLGPLYTNTRDIAREVFTEPVLASTFASPYTRCKLSFYRKMFFLNEDLVHSRSLHRMYADGNGVRAFPSQELADAEAGAAALPPVAGMGKLWMDYLTGRIDSIPLIGSVEGLEGYNYSYVLPEPPNRTKIVFVLDNARFPDYENATMNGPYHIILHHTYSPAIAFAEHEKHRMGDTFKQLTHPSILSVTAHRSFYYRLFISSPDQ